MRAFMATSPYFAAVRVHTRDARNSSVLPTLTSTGNLLAGATTRVGVGFLLNPFSVLKAQFESNIYAYQSLSGALVSITRQGPSELLRGFLASSLRDAPYAGLFIVFYEGIKRETYSLFPTTSSAHAAAIHSISAASAGAIATLATHPFDVIKTKIQVRSEERYHGLWRTIRTIWQQRGVSGYFDGASLRLSRKVLSSAIGWAVYEGYLISAARRTSPSPTSGTGTTNASPMFSAQVSAAASETPATSDCEETKKKVQAARARGIRRKRAVSSDLDQSEPEMTSVKRPALKRRAVTSTCFVEIAPSQSTSGKGKGKEKASTPSSRPNGKGKGKAPAAPASDDENVEMASDASLDYKEIEESDDSGSDFVVSEQEGEDAFAASDSEEEALMLSAAAEMSLQTSRPNATSGSSSSQRNPTNKGAALAAAAAERRMARAKKDIDVNDYMSGDEDEDDTASDSYAPLSRNGKGKGKAPAKKRKKTAPAPIPTVPRKHMTLAQLRAEKKEQRSKANEWKKEIKAEEKRLMLELGRRLTYAEKSSLALLKHHPELKDVWGDLEESIPIIKPTMAVQPDNLKLTLLPFQRESLFWMRKQEQGIWHGGMLADEMGMGKTIQIISLLVSDNVKPNLVVAPTVAVMQWRNEIETHTDGLKVLVWHGSSRETNHNELKKYDVVGIFRISSVSWAKHAV
ncbi:hypothetical protein C0991_009993 [Blastosporella zonata]|nr:hypothetical protein C0991_009993 [Blastosporella zonata]